MRGKCVIGFSGNKRRMLLAASSVLCLSALLGGSASAEYASTPANPAIVLASQNADVVTAAQSFIQGMAQRAIDFLANQSLGHAEKSAKFKALLSDSFDLKTIGRFALGKYWKVATPAEQSEYLKLFETMVVDVYSNRFKDYQGQDLVVDGAKPEGDRDVLVTSFIVPPDGPKVQVDWRVRGKDGRYRIVDIIVEGVSMAVTQRSEFASVIQSGGGNVSVLLEHLRK